MKLPRRHLRRLALTPVAVAACQWATMGTVQAQAQPQTPPQAPAQAESVQEIDRVVVTARRIKERLQDVPVAVSAFDAEQIRANGLQGLEDVARLTPGFSFERTTGALAQPAIRGQAQFRVTNPVQNVATYLNGIYLQRSYQVDSDMLGLERVEVLKGPQSALFGRNAFAGAISYVTQKPSLSETALRGEITLGNYDRRDYKVFASVPFSSQAAFSLAASWSKSDGTWPNANGPSAAISGPGLFTKGNLNGYDNKGTLLQFRVQPTDLSEVSVFWSNRSIFIESPANYQMAARGLVSAFNNMNCNPFEASLQAANGVNAMYCGALTAQPALAPGEPRSPGLVADRRAYSQDSTTNVVGASLEVSVSDKMTLNATLGRTSADNMNNATLSRDPQRGITFSPFLPAVLNNVLLDSRGNGSLTSDSLEVRLSYDTRRLRYMVGGFYSTVKDYSFGSTYVALPNTGTELNNTFLPAGNLFPPGFSASQRDEQIAGAFGSVTMEPIDGLRVTAEGRYTHERVTEQAVTYPDQTPFGTQFSKAFKYFTPRLTADYKLAPSAMLYASVAQGVKSGGFNTAAGLQAADQIYEPEKNWTYELGLKSTTADGSLLFNVSGYLVDWTNLQMNRTATGAAIGTPALIGNVSGADVKGLEATLRWRPVRTFTLDAGASYNRSVYKDGAVDPQVARALCSAATVLTTCPLRTLANIGGNTVARAPSVMGTLGGTWRSTVGNLGGRALILTARGDVSYQSRMYVDPTNTAWVPARTLLNGSIGIESAKWSLRLWGRNLTDRQYVSYAFTTFAASGAGSGITYAPLLGDRRTLGATLSVSY